MCGAHGGGRRRNGAPKGNQNARKHGYYSAPVRPLTSLEDLIEDLGMRQARLSAYIDRQGDDISIQDIVRLLRLHGRTASRLQRLLRGKRALSEEASHGAGADGLSEAIAQTLDELGVGV